MEYAKDVILDLKNGQAKVKGRNANSKKGVFLKIGDKISRHKIMSTVITATVSFIVLDMVLIINFVNVLTKI